MKTLALPGASRPHAAAAAALLLVLPAGVVPAQDAAESTADADIRAAREAQRGAADAGGPGSASGEGEGEGVLGQPPRDRAADAVDRSRARALTGDRPGDPPPERLQGRPPSAVTDLPPGVTEGGGSAVTGGAGRGTAPSEGRTPIHPGVDARLDQAAPRRDPATTAGMIRETGFPYRDRAVSMIETELSQGDALDSALKSGAPRVSGLARRELDGAIRELGESRTRLAQSISRARAADERRWEDSREEVVERYNDFVAAQRAAREAAGRAGLEFAPTADAERRTP